MKILNFLNVKKVLTKLILNSFFFFCCFSFLHGFTQSVVSGPLQGYTTDSSAVFWILTKNSNSLSVVDLNSMIKFNKIEILEDQNVHASFKKYRGYKYVIHFDKKNSGFFHYGIMLNNNDLFSYSFKSNPSEKSSFLFGSCAYIGKGFSRGFRPWNITKIYSAMQQERSDFMLWMGDNIYLMLNHDLKSTKSIYKRYLGVRTDKDLNRFLTSGIQHYSILDDHDFGSNDCDGSFKNAALTTSAFLNFWPNPKPVNEKGIYYTFKKGDVEFFMTDSRTFRNNDGSSFLGEKQLNWLKLSLKNSNSIFKIVVLSNQLINNAKGHESYYDFPEERASLINYIMSNKIPGILFFSGDRHHSEIQKEDNDYLYPIYDITCSALSSPRPKLRGWGPEGKMKKRLPGTFITHHNYGKAIVQGVGKNKSLKIDLNGPKGQTYYSISFKMKDLGY